MKIRNIVISILVVGALGAGGWWALQPQPVGVDLAEVKTGTLVTRVSEEGTAQVRDIYHISTPVGGEVMRIPLAVGDHVERDQVVARIVPQLSGFLDQRTLAQAEAAVGAAEAAVSSAQTQIEAAEKEVSFWQTEVERTQRLFERGLATQQALAQAQFSLEQKQLALEAAKALLGVRSKQLDQARAQLVEPNGNGERSVTYEVRTPVAGQVLAIENESTRSLLAGTPLMTVGNPRNLEIVADLLSTDAVQVKAGAPAIVDGWGRDVPLDAVVRRIEPVGFTKVSALGIEEQRVRLHLDITTDPEVWHSLGHMYRVMVHIETARAEDAILVPISAMFREGNAWSVFVATAGVAHLKAIEVGLRDETQAQVLSGLTSGEKVIVHPSDQIAEGSMIVDRSTLAN